MRFLFRFLIASPLLATFIGCVSATKQVDAMLATQMTHQSFKPSHQIEGVPFVNQTAGYCGPATMAMAINWAGKNRTVDDIAPLVYTPGMKGSFQADMISAARREGFLAIPIWGFSSLFQEIKAGHPVIVFENLAVSWLPQWHYAIVFGYDLGQETVLMHSGPEAFKQWDLRKFERSWMLADYWGLLVLPPDELSATADELTHTTAAAGLEQVGHAAQALAAYRTILKRWPASLGSLIGLANDAFIRKDFREAVAFLKTATKENPRAAAAWHNRAIAESAANMKSAARASARQALTLVSKDLYPQYENSLRDLLL